MVCFDYDDYEKTVPFFLMCEGISLKAEHHTRIDDDNMSNPVQAAIYYTIIESVSSSTNLFQKSSTITV